MTALAHNRLRPRFRLRPEAVWAYLDLHYMSQHDFAVFAGISPGYLSRLLNGTKFPSPRVRRLLQKSLECPRFDDLFVQVGSNE